MYLSLQNKPENISCMSLLSRDISLLSFSILKDLSIRYHRQKINTFSNQFYGRDKIINNFIFIK